jgi:hypothetical protein
VVFKIDYAPVPTSRTAAYRYSNITLPSAAVLLVQIINQAIQLTQGDTGRCKDVITKKLEDILRCVRPCQGGSSDAATPAAAAAFGSTSAAAAAAGAPASTLSLAAGTGAGAGAGTSPVQALPLPGPRELHALLKLCVTVELLTQWDKARDHLRTQAGQGQLQAFWEEYAVSGQSLKYAGWETYATMPLQGPCLALPI